MLLGAQENLMRELEEFLGKRRPEVIDLWQLVHGHKLTTVGFFGHSDLGEIADLGDIDIRPADLFPLRNAIGAQVLRVAEDRPGFF